ncbi:MAG: HupE/UreJ family protein [Ignavibacteria bacterium]|nr:HupE/UreJ family protein [Ignavibacteria bacterium]
MKTKFLFPITLLIICFAPSLIFAHPIDLDKLSRLDISWLYLQLGFTHILPYGFDHILFILGLYLMCKTMKQVIMLATTFTIAHSITLGLAMFNVVSVPANIVEPLIAITILAVAVEVIFVKDFRKINIAIVFFFGLAHGLGFAGALQELGLPKQEFGYALVLFNLGVELGQISVIMLAYFLFGKWTKNKVWYKQKVAIPLSIVIGLTAIYWTVERVIEG